MAGRLPPVDLPACIGCIKMQRPSTSFFETDPMPFHSTRTRMASLLPGLALHVGAIESGAPAGDQALRSVSGPP